MAATRIDCDIHPAVGGTRTTLLPYLDDHWKEQVVSRAIDGLDLTSYPPSMPLSGRPDWRHPQGKPGSDLSMVQRGAFDQLGSSHAICNVLYGAQAVFDPYMAAAFCKAINDWIAAEWLAKDSRLSASIVVPMQAPDLAVEEIERRAGDNRFVSVLVLAQGETLLGRRHYWPVWQAAEKHKLPVAIHAGSAYRTAPSSIGWPSYRYEYYLAEAQAFQAQILSLIYEGAFGKFPGLKIVLMESGVSWLPAFMWRANKTWRGVRVEVPWIDREPAAIMRDHIRLTTQPFDAPPDAAGVADIIDMIGSDKMFLFASDYPHWHFNREDPAPHHRLRCASEPACVCRPQPVPAETLAAASEDLRQSSAHALYRHHALSAVLAADRAPRCLAADQRPARIRSRLHAEAAPRSARYRVRYPAGARPVYFFATEPRIRRGDPARHQRVAACVLVRPRPTAESLDPGRTGRHRSRHRRDRSLRQNRPLYADQCLSARQRAARTPPLLADLRARRSLICRSAFMSAAMAATRRPAAAGRPITSRSINRMRI